MNDSDMTKEFLIWVTVNHGETTRSALEAAMRNKPCDTRAQLFEQLWKVLDRDSASGLKPAGNLYEIQFNS